MLNPKTKSMLGIIMAVLIWSASFAAIKIAVTELTPSSLVFSRFIMGTLFLGAFAYLKKTLILLPKNEMITMAQMGFIGVFLHSVLQGYGLQTAQANVAGLITGCIPIVTGLIASYKLKEHLRSIQWLGILTAAAGLVVILSRGSLASLSANSFNVGELLMTGSVFTWSIFSIYSKPVLEKRDPVVTMFYAMLFGSLFALVPFLTEGGITQIQNLTKTGWYSLVYLGLFCSAIAYALWYAGLKTLSAAEVSIFLYLNPPLSAAASAILLGEKINSSVLLGGLIIITGIWLVNKNSATPAKTTEKETQETKKK